MLFDVVIGDTVEDIEYNDTSDREPQQHQPTVGAQTSEHEEVAEEDRRDHDARRAEREHGAAQGVEGDTQPHDQHESDQRGGVDRHCGQLGVREPERIAEQGGDDDIQRDTDRGGSGAGDDVVGEVAAHDVFVRL